MYRNKRRLKSLELMNMIYTQQVDVLWKAYWDVVKKLFFASVIVSDFLCGLQIKRVENLIETAFAVC